jgi:hypothetical protein
MRLEVLGGMVIGVVSIGCGRMLDVRAQAVSCSSMHTYSRAEVDTIMRLRDDGAGLADVARVVGGSRCDVRSAEVAEKSRRRGHLDPVAVVSR